MDNFFSEAVDRVSEVFRCSEPKIGGKIIKFPGSEKLKLSTQK